MKSRTNLVILTTMQKGALKMRRTVPVLAVAAVSAVIIVGSGGLAGAETPSVDSFKPQPGLIAESQVPKGVVDAPAAAPEEESRIPAVLHDALWRLSYNGALNEVNTVAWDDAAKSLVFYSSQDAHQLGAVIAEEINGASFRLERAANAKSAIDGLLLAIERQGGVLSDSARVVTAGTTPDAARLVVGVEGSIEDSERLLRELVDAHGLELELDVAESLEVTPATRNVSSSIRFAGAYMELTNGGGACSTAYKIGQTSTGIQGMLSADHCGVSNNGTMWRYSTNTAPSSNLSTYGGMLSVPPLTADLGRWSGTTGTASFYAYVFTGDHNNVSTISQVRGVSSPVLNDSVCYSGSRSGNWCGNTITYVNMLVCYGPTQCYQGQAITENFLFAPAGNGDSGGPVYAVASGLLKAQGVISGMVGGDQASCMGDPGSATRICSQTAIYAPLGLGINASTGWALYYYP